MVKDHTDALVLPRQHERHAKLDAGEPAHTFQELMARLIDQFNMLPMVHVPMLYDELTLTEKIEAGQFTFADYLAQNCFSADRFMRY